MSVPRDHHVKSIIKLFRIVEALDRQGAVGVTKLARETGLAKSSVYKYLSTLEHIGYVTKSGTTYSLSFRWFQLGRQVRSRNDVFRIAQYELDQLARRIGETVFLVVEERGDAVYLYQTSERETPVGPVNEGGRIPAPISVGGKAILSHRPIDAVETLLADQDLEDSAEQLLAELRTLRNQRMVIERESPWRGAFSAGAFQGHRHVIGHGEPYQSLHSIAVPVRNSEGYAIAAIEVSGSESTLHGRRLEEEIPGLLVDASKSIESALLSG